MKRTKKILSLILSLCMLFSITAGMDITTYAFTQRTTMPTSSNAYYYANNPFYKSGFGLPNCTCYAFGRAYEVNGTYPKLSTGKASTFYTYNKSNNYYSYGSAPRAGSIACWSGGSSEAGHVAFVESVNSNGTINISESNWSGRQSGKEYMAFRYLTNINPNSYSSNLTFQGYIYCCNGDFYGITFHAITTVDNKGVGFDGVDIPNVGGQEIKYWFKKWIDDSNYYVNIYLDNVLVVDHGAVDSSNLISYVINTSSLNDGLHSIKADLAYSTGSYSVERKFNVFKGVSCYGISSEDNQGVGLEGVEIPVLGGQKFKYWFKKNISDENYYVNIYVDNVLVADHRAVDSSNLISWIVNTSNYNDGLHSIRTDLAYTDGCYTSKRYFYVFKGVSFGGFTDTDNHAVFSGVEVPTISGNKYNCIFNTNLNKSGYTANIYVDGKLVKQEKLSSSNGKIYYTIDPSVWSNGSHEIKAIINVTDGTYECNKTFNIYNCSHSYSTSIIKKATCTTTGQRKYVCSKCDYSYIDTIEKLSHKSISSNNAIKATCTTTGKESDTKCSVCGIKLTTGKTISATGHKSVLSNNAIAPTCTTDGKESDTKCSTCGVKLTTGKTIPATNHSYAKTKVVAPAYAAKGYTLYTCSTCKATKKSDYKNALTVAKPTISNVTSPKSKQIKVTWGKKSYTGYQVQIATDSKFTKNKKSATIKSAKTVSKTFTGLKGKIKYYVRVRAYKTYNGKNYYSSWSTVKTVTTKK